RTALVQVVLPGADVGEAGRDTTLRGGPAFRVGIDLKRVIDAPVLMGVHHARECEQAVGVDNLCGVGGIEVGLNRGEPLAADADVQWFRPVDAGTDDSGVLDEQVEPGHGAAVSLVSVPTPGRAAGSLTWRASGWTVTFIHGHNGNDEIASCRAVASTASHSPQFAHRPGTRHSRFMMPAAASSWPRATSSAKRRL